MKGIPLFVPLEELPGFLPPFLRGATAPLPPTVPAAVERTGMNNRRRSTAKAIAMVSFAILFTSTGQGEGTATIPVGPERPLTTQEVLINSANGPESADYAFATAMATNGRSASVEVVSDAAPAVPGSTNQPQKFKGFMGRTLWIPQPDQATIEKLKTANSRLRSSSSAKPGKRGPQNLEEAAEYLARNVNMACPPGAAVEYENTFYFSGGLSTHPETDFLSGFAITKGDTAIYAWQRGPEVPSISDHIKMSKLEMKGARVSNASEAKRIATAACERKSHFMTLASEGVSTIAIIGLGFEVPKFCASGTTIWEIRFADLFRPDLLPALRAIIWIHPDSGKTHFLTSPWQSEAERPEPFVTGVLGSESDARHVALQKYTQSREGESPDDSACEVRSQVLGFGIEGFAKNGDRIWEARLLRQETLSAIIWLNPSTEKGVVLYGPPEVEEAGKTQTGKHAERAK